MNPRDLAASSQIQTELLAPSAGNSRERKSLRIPSRSEYLRKYVHRVPGYLRNPDAALIAALLEWQEKIGVSGNLCEIGVHHGRLFLLLALSRKLNEKALAIDLFEDDEINQGTQSGRSGGLFRQASRLNVELSPEETLKSSSLDLTAEDILNRIGGPVRFFSVDGGHMYHHVENDMRLAYRCLAPNGIIAADDFFYLKWPEVSFAVYDFMRATPDIAPVLATNRKLYLARREFAEQMLDFVRSTPPRGIIVEYPTDVLGNKIALLRISLLDRAKQELRARLAK